MILKTYGSPHLRIKYEHLKIFLKQESDVLNTRVRILQREVPEPRQNAAERKLEVID